MKCFLGALICLGLAAAVHADNCVTQADGTVVCDVPPAAPAEGWTATAEASGGSYGSTAHAAASGGSHGRYGAERRAQRRADRQHRRAARQAQRAHRRSAGGSYGSTAHASSGGSHG